MWTVPSVAQTGRTLRAFFENPMTPFEFKNFCESTHVLPQTVRNPQEFLRLMLVARLGSVAKCCADGMLSQSVGTEGPDAESVGIRRMEGAINVDRHAMLLFLGDLLNTSALMVPVTPHVDWEQVNYKSGAFRLSIEASNRWEFVDAQRICIYMRFPPEEVAIAYVKNTRGDDHD